jgi:cytochrome c oxidase assembly protein subunit 15
LIYGYMLWLALDLLFPRPISPGVPGAGRGAVRLFPRAVALLCLALLVIASGAFVAGLHAGLIDNSFPLMEGRLAPPGLWLDRPLLANLFENPVTAQFDHRLLAESLVALLLLFWATSWRWRATLPARARAALDVLPLLALLQASLGVTTLLLVVPLPLAAAHQAGALAVFTAALWLSHELRGARSA